LRLEGWADEGYYKHPVNRGERQAGAVSDSEFFFIAKAFGKWFLSSPTKNGPSWEAALWVRQFDSRTNEPRIECYV
jgi:hypothetical protein